jgi:hypothetical protein
MEVSPTLRDVASQLQQLNTVKPQTPQSAKIAINQLNDLSSKILTIIEKGGGGMSPREMNMIGAMSFRLAQLQGRFHKKSSTGIICKKMARVSRKEKVNEVRMREGVEDQLRRLDELHPEGPEDAEKALNDLLKISSKIHAALEKPDKPMTLKERKYVKSLVNTIAKLHVRFLEKTSPSEAIAKINIHLKKQSS